MIQLVDDLFPVKRRLHFVHNLKVENNIL
jgi:hypothetical protein